MSWAIPSDTHAAGDTGHVTDHDNMADVLTDLDNANRSRYLAPAGATAETIPRAMGLTGTSSALTSGTLYLTAIGLHQNTVVSNITFCVRGTAESGGTHAWFVLADSGLVVRAVTADQTGATALGATQTPVTFATNSYTTSYSGLFYVGVCVVASGMPLFLTGPTLPSGMVSAAPVLCGPSSTGQTTPPAAGASLTAITANNGYNFYAYTS